MKYYVCSWSTISCLCGFYRPEKYRPEIQKNRYISLYDYYIPDNCCFRVTMKLLMAQLHNTDFLKVFSVVKALEVVLA